MMKKTAIAASVSIILAGVVAPSAALASDKNVVVDTPKPIISVPTSKTIHPKKPDF